MAKTKTKKISERAVKQRLNRKLAKDQEILRAHRDGRELPMYYHVDLKRNAIIDDDIELEQFARDQGVLAAWETIES